MTSIADLIQYLAALLFVFVPPLVSLLVGAELIDQQFQPTIAWVGGAVGAITLLASSFYVNLTQMSDKRLGKWILYLGGLCVIATLFCFWFDELALHLTKEWHFTVAPLL